MMENKNPDILINEANQLLNSAIEEMQRAEEDVSAYSVCFNSRQSIVNYLISYLSKNGVELKRPVTVAGLMDQCRSIDGRFELIDISQIFCSHDDRDEEYCLDVQKVAKCLQVAKQTRAISTDESPAY
jgi:hypothetical protein